MISELLETGDLIYKKVNIFEVIHLNMDQRSCHDLWELLALEKVIQCKSDFHLERVLYLGSDTLPRFNTQCLNGY